MKRDALPDRAWLDAPFRITTPPAPHQAGGGFAPPAEFAGFPLPAHGCDLGTDCQCPPSRVGSCEFAAPTLRPTASTQPATGVDRLLIASVALLGLIGVALVLAA